MPGIPNMPHGSFPNNLPLPALIRSCRAAMQTTCSGKLQRVDVAAWDTKYATRLVSQSFAPAARDLVTTRRKEGPFYAVKHRLQANVRNCAWILMASSWCKADWTQREQLNLASGWAAPRMEKLRPDYSCGGNAAMLEFKMFVCVCPSKSSF